MCPVTNARLRLAQTVGPRATPTVNKRGVRLAVDLDADKIARFESSWGRLPRTLGLLPPQESQGGWRHMLDGLDELAQAADLRPADIGLVDVSRWHLRVLQTLVRHWLTHVADDGSSLADVWETGGFRRPSSDAETWWFWQDHMNAALSPFRMHIRLNEDSGQHRLQLPWPTLYSVAALQLAQLIAEGHAVRVCANERCGNYFTRQRGRARFSVGTHGYDTQKYQGVRYCSHRCAKAQSERERRNRKRAERNQP